MDSGSVKHCMMTRGTIGELIPSFRSQIDRHDEQICDIRHFAPWQGEGTGGVWGPHAVLYVHMSTLILGTKDLNGLNPGNQRWF